MNKKFEFKEINDYLISDPLGNIYTINSQEFVKHNSKGQTLSRYSTRKFGNISNADAGNPLKIILFFKDFSVIQFLDNMLNPANDAIALETMEIPRAGMVCRAFDNGFWVFDTDKIQLQRYSNQNELISSSGNLNQLISNAIKISDIKEANNKVYLLNVDSTLFEFDIFGTYLKSLKIKGNTKFQIKDSFILTWNEFEIFIFDEKSFSERVIPFNDFKIKSISFFNNDLIISDGNTIAIYEIL